MLRKKIIFVAIATFTMAIASGCHLYIEDNEPFDDDGEWSGDGDGDWSEPGSDCSANPRDCAPGCYCTSPEDGSFCEESGFCSDDANNPVPCPDGYECGRDGDGDGVNETCIPEGDGPGQDGDDCNADNICDDGLVCGDEGACRPFECADHGADDDACVADASLDCTPVYEATCTNPTGETCEEGTTDCVCVIGDPLACIDTPVEP